VRYKFITYLLTYLLQYNWYILYIAIWSWIHGTGIVLAAAVNCFKKHVFGDNILPEK